MSDVDATMDLYLLNEQVIEAQYAAQAAATNLLWHQP